MGNRLSNAVCGIQTLSGIILYFLWIWVSNIESKGHQSLHLKCWSLLWSYYDHLTQRMNCQAYSMVCVCIFQAELEKGEGSSRYLRCTWTLPSFLWKLTLLWHYKHSNGIQQYFSTEKCPTLWQALPTIEELQTTWEAECNDYCFLTYRIVINNGLEKLKKYYSWFDKKPTYIIALGMSPLWALSFSEWCLNPHSPAPLFQTCIH